MAEFAKQLRFTTKPAYTYHVLTFGMTTGQAHRMMEAHLGLPLKGKFTVKMVDTWTPMFDLTDTAANEKTLEAAEPQIDTIARQVLAHTTGDFNKDKMPLAGLYYRLYQNGRKTKSFTISEACTGCGRCAAQCPVHAIQLENGQPHWAKAQCALCLGCLHRCPKFAIQYGKKTMAHGQYVNPKAEL